MEESEKPAYYSIIPANVRYDKNLKPMEKLLFSEITSLLNMNGVCFASNEYFANLYDCSTRIISSYIKQLEKNGYIKIKYECDGVIVTKRLITLTDKNVFEETCKVKKQKKERTTKKPLLEREPENDIEEVEKIYLENYQKLYKQGIVKTEKPIINWQHSRKLARTSIDKYGKQLILEAVKKSVDSDFVVSRGYILTMILSAGVLNCLINGKSSETKGFKTGAGIDLFSGTVEF